MTVTDRPELNTLRRRSFDVFVREIGLRFVEAYVKRPWARSVDVPVLVGILLLVRHFRPVQLRRRAYKTVISALDTYLRCHESRGSC